MLHEATQSFSVQVEGLRQILDGLRVQAAAVDGATPPDQVKAAAEVSEGNDVEPDQSGKPTTAALEKEGVLE
jgi:hypothetical protein